MFFNHKRDVQVADESRPLLQINMSGKRANGKFTERNAAISISFPRDTKDRIDEVVTLIGIPAMEMLVVLPHILATVQIKKRDDFVNRGLPTVRYLWINHLSTSLSSPLSL